MRGINPKYLDRLEESQRKFILTAPGKFFADNFIFMPAEHGYVIGPTGSGKTNKNYNIVNWLKYTETILWISASKDHDILPLLFMGLPVNIIVPKYAGVEITLDRKPYTENLVYSQVDQPSDVFTAIKGDHINILETRNAFWSRDNLLDWMVGFFKALAEGCRRDSIKYIHPPSYKGEKSKVAVIIDESQWLIAGTKVTNDPKRVKATEEIASCALEVRTYGWRLVISSQGFTNIVPVIRENMPCVFLCANAQVPDVPSLRYHCNPQVYGFIPTSRFKRNEYKFIDRQGRASPNNRPLPTPLYPKKEEDRAKMARMGIKYAKTYHDQPTDSAEVETELIPDMGRFSHLMVQPEHTEQLVFSRFEQVVNNG